MKEVQGNLWTFPADVRVITTNGTVKNNGEAVMGRGCAFEAKTRYRGLPKVIGAYLTVEGNHVHHLGRYDDFELFTFPVKHQWMQQADPELIKQSAIELVEHIGILESKVVLPRPGCGNGKLRWEDVKPILEPILDDRFSVITF